MASGFHEGYSGSGWHQMDPSYSMKCDSAQCQQWSNNQMAGWVGGLGGGRGGREKPRGKRLLFFDFSI